MQLSAKMLKSVFKCGGVNLLFGNTLNCFDFSPLIL